MVLSLPLLFTSPFLPSSFTLSSILCPPTVYFCASSPCAAALHEAVSDRVVRRRRRIKAGIYYVAAVQWNADVHCVPIHPSTSVASQSLSECLGLQTTGAKLQAAIISFRSLSFLQALGCTLPHCKITPFQHTALQRSEGETDGGAVGAQG